MTTMRPRPTITELNAPFFEALTRAELALQRCDTCSHLRYPIATVCPRCLSASCSWEVLSGRARVHSTVVFHQVYRQAFADEVPYNVSIVELDEGPLMMTNVVGVAPEQVRVGDPVTLHVADLGDGAVLPQFVPASGREKGAHAEH